MYWLGWTASGLTAASAVLLSACTIIGVMAFPVTLPLLAYAIVTIPLGLIMAARHAQPGMAAERWLRNSAVASLLVPVSPLWIFFCTSSLLVRHQDAFPLALIGGLWALLLPLPICLLILTRGSFPASRWPYRGPAGGGAFQAGLSVVASATLSAGLLAGAYFRLPAPIVLMCLFGSVLAAGIAAHSLATCVTRTGLSLMTRHRAFARANFVERPTGKAVAKPDAHPAD